MEQEEEEETFTPTTDDLRQTIRRRRSRLRHNRLILTLEERNESDALKQKWRWVFLFALVVVLVIAWVTLRITGLLVMYARLRKLYDRMEDEGDRKYTFTQVVVAAEYPAFYTVWNATFSAPALRPNGARFLLLALELFGERMTRAAWSGSPQELKKDQWRDYISSFHAWVARSNTFYFIFPGKREFDTSIAVKCAKENPDRLGTLDLLYTGGFCAIAAAMAKDEVPTERMALLIARFVIQRRDCPWEKGMATAFAVSNAIGAGSAIGMALSFVSLLNPVTLLLTAASTIALAGVMGKQAHDVAACSVKEGEYSLGGDSYTTSDLSCTKM